MCVISLTSITSASNLTTCVPISSQKCMTSYTVINLYTNEDSQEFRYDSFAINQGRCARSCKPLDDLFSRVW